MLAEIVTEKSSKQRQDLAVTNRERSIEHIAKFRSRWDPHRLKNRRMDIRWSTRKRLGKGPFAVAAPIGLASLNATPGH